MTPNDRNFSNDEPFPYCKKQDLRIKAEAVDRLFFKDGTSLLPVEELEAALGIFDAQS